MCAPLIARLDLPGGGLWVSKLHTVIAFGVFYFGLLAVTKACDSRLPSSHLPDIERK